MQHFNVASHGTLMMKPIRMAMDVNACAKANWFLFNFWHTLRSRGPRSLAVVNWSSLNCLPISN